MTDADIGGPISYLVLEEGTRVECRDGLEVGTVDAVIADEDDDIFDGITVETDNGLRFIEADIVGDLHERLVTLKISGSDVPSLPDPSAGPGEFAVDADAEDQRLMTRLARAFEGRFGDLWRKDRG